MDLSGALGSALRHARLRRQLTLEELSLLTRDNFSPEVLGDYESGRDNPSVVEFVQLASLLGQTPEHLLSEAIRRVTPDANRRIVIDLSRLLALDGEDLPAVAQLIWILKTQRKDLHSDRISLRAGDLELMANAHGVDPSVLFAEIEPALKVSNGTG